MEELHLFLNDCRKKSGWSIEEFAALANIDYRTMHSLLNGKTVPTFKTILKIADTLMVDYRDLLSMDCVISHDSIVLWEKELNELFQSGEYDQATTLLNVADVLESKSINYESSVSIEKIRQFYTGLLLPFPQQISKSKDILTDSLFLGNSRKPVPDFIPKSIIDSRILSNIAICESSLKNEDLAAELYLHSQSPFPQIKTYEPIRLLNLSITYHRMNKQKKVLEYSQQGIKDAIECNKSHLLERFFFRKGIAEYKLGLKQYLHTLQNLILLEELEMIHHKHHLIIHDLEKHYGIVRKGNIFIQE